MLEHHTECKEIMLAHILLQVWFVGICGWMMFDPVSQSFMNWKYGPHTGGAEVMGPVKCRTWWELISL